MATFILYSVLIFLGAFLSWLIIHSGQTKTSRHQQHLHPEARQPRPLAKTPPACGQNTKIYQ